MPVSKEEVRDMAAFSLMLDLQRIVWDLKVRLKVVEGRLGIKGQSELPELPALEERDRLQEWADSLG